MPLCTFSRFLKSTIVSALSLALVLGSGVCRANEFDREQAETFSTMNLAPLVKRISPAVVGIRAWGLPSEPRIFDPEAGFPDPPTPREWQGAGVVVDALAGFIVTANHLVASASVVKAQLQDGRALDALVLVRSDRDDVALLRVAPDNLRAITLDYASALEVGAPVLAIGNPGDWGQSVTVGIVSALHRSCPGIANGDLIQSDVRVAQGSSGGALVNLQGKLIGVVLARRSGFAFAAPVDAVRRLFVAAQ
ncbi:trypsin-like peptidase domain-containing protein [Bradyrhizobium sp. WYCCWR 13023]|uniref:Trypsin-like peptidase domain-containing protein n=2 Tax=Bradyrhizobium TaxID=374 RepID=A0A9X1U737_9BRAD|nr:trypsin-like peptidase domain-containing protein [Bradyrhizobium zhengyangense]MCG2626491.1 trypsin-like peptidase domain-containing protein [Bradyrhizobium zhengyangense]MCG2640456.1 trypsin-like peptidase domain-containing protein [Bradyrhizobium zhengyangense]MCG2665776.1 trypsin-like peptidase domain-containing protein [Bradyrhizobium zhengyangense]